MHIEASGFINAKDGTEVKFLKGKGILYESQGMITVHFEEDFRGIEIDSVTFVIREDKNGK